MKLHFVKVLDKSSSMGSIRKQTLEGINQSIESARANGAREGAEIIATLLLFDQPAYSDGFEFRYAGKPAQELTHLAWDDYVPRGMTALNDAIAHAVKKAQEINGDDDVQTLVEIFTDGEENASRDFTREQIMTMISELTATEKWTFSFVGAGGIAEVQTTAQGYGISLNNVMAYDGTVDGSAVAFSGMAAMVTGVTTRSLSRGTMRTTENLYAAAENFAPVE